MAPKKKVFVGMSGGVDSSVSAALLKKQGYDVTGVFIRVWQPDWLECDWREERLDAMRVAAHLDIPFVTLDLEREYKEGVIDYMLAEYSAGRTPNPDVMCNREVKFGAFWRWAEGQGADFIATGHYAKIIGEGSKKALLVSADTDKDQTYFLWTLTNKDLAHVLFPVGDMTKREARALARKYGLPNAGKKDSQGLCFIGKVDFKEFLRHHIKTEEGAVLDEKGEKIGTHPGALLFTIGERHGFKTSKKTPADDPYYVISKDIAANTITVSTRDKATAKLSSNAKSVELSKTSWVLDAPLVGETLLARARYREPLSRVKIVSIDPDKRVASLEFVEPQDTLTPGQSLVIYKDQECLGGGIIV